MNIDAPRKLVLLFFLVNVLLPVHAACVVGEDGKQSQTLFAGQNIDIGTVSLQVVDSHLIVDYQVNEDWRLNEVHLWIGESLSQMPQTRKGSPKIGNFPYKSGELTDALSYQFSLPLESLQYFCPGEDKTYYVAAHAAVHKITLSGDIIQEETAWADGDRFVEKGMWGTFFSITLSCSCGDVPPVAENCETAFAYSGGTNILDGDLTNSFLEIDEDGDSVGDFNRWGWSNGPISSGSYVWDIYAGAGQSDISKGVLVGNLVVQYDGSTMVVEFVLNSPYYLLETHLYVGGEILPRDNNNQFTVAPGRYPYIHDLDRTSYDSYLVTTGNGGQYIVAHSVVCGF